MACRLFVILLMFTVLGCMVCAQDSKLPFATSVGDDLPELTAKTIRGEDWSSKAEAEARVVVIIDPASTVSRQFAEPLETFVWKSLQDKPVLVCAVIRGADEDQAKAFAKESKLSLPMIADPDRKISERFAAGGRGVPRTIIADKEGVINYQHGGYSPGREAEFVRVAELVAEGKAMGGISMPGQGADAMPLGAVKLVGKKAPELHVERWVTVEPESTEGKYVLTEFWATWCGPCIAMMPHLQKLSDEQKEKLIVRSISDETPEEVSAFIREAGFTYPIGLDTQRRTANELRVMSIPHGYIANPQGVVVWQGHPGELIFEEGLLEKILNGELDPKE